MIPKSKEEGGCNAATGAAARGGDSAMLAWNSVAMGRDGVPVVGTTGVMARSNGASTNEAPRDNEEAGLGAATSAPLWDGVDASVGTTVT